jgi:integrase
VTFNSHYPNILCDQITPAVATAWLVKPSIAYETTEVNVLKQILKWAAEEQLIDRSLLAAMKLSKGNRREAVLTMGQHRKLVAAAKSPDIRCLLWFAWWTGSRPIELRNLRWSDLSKDCSTASLVEHKNARKTQRPRVIYFCPNAASLLRAGQKRATGDLVFLNSRGNKWTKDAVVCLLRRLRLKTGIDATAYAYRHSYATRAIEQGVGVADLAEILGTSIEVISRNYAHLDKSRKRLADIAAKVT